MPNRIIELAQQIIAEQHRAWDHDEETDEQYLGRLALEDRWLGGIYYQSNSVSWSHAKATNYGHQLQKAWDELRKLGIHPDGVLTVAEAIAKHCVKRQ